MQLILKYIFSVLTGCLLASAAMGQRSYKDSTQTTGIRIGVDLAKIAYGKVFPDNRQYEISADIGYKRTYLITEFGVADIRNTQPTFNYQAQGYFSRTGPDYNILRGDDMIFVGFRYAFSRLQHRFDDVQIVDQYYGNYSTTIPERTVRASWVELVGGVKVRLFSQLFLGFTTRYKIKASLKDGGIMPQRIPGYGLAPRSTRIGMEYYLSYKIPLFKNKVYEIK
jgi:hypothetical protein